MTRGEVLLAGRRLEPGAWTTLESGARLVIGELQLTFLGPEGLLERLAGAPAAGPPPG